MSYDMASDCSVRFNRLGDYLNPDSERFWLMEGAPVPFSSTKNWAQHYDRGIRNNDHDHVSFRQSYLRLKDSCPPLDSASKQSDGGRRGKFLDTIAYLWSRPDPKHGHYEGKIAALKEEFKNLKAQTETLRQETEAIPSSVDEQSIDDNVPSTCNCQKGILGQRHLFDFALLANDFRAWNSEGLELTSVLSCLDDSHLRLGPRLRAHTLEHEDEIHLSFHERVKIGEQH